MKATTAKPINRNVLSCSGATVKSLRGHHVRWDEEFDKGLFTKATVFLVVKLIGCESRDAHLERVRLLRHGQPRDVEGVVHEEVGLPAHGSYPQLLPGP